MSNPKTSLPHAPGELTPQVEEQVRAALDAAGCRYTQQRAAVYAYLRSVSSHPAAEEVYSAVRRQMPRISLATVYKALEALVGARLATKHSGNAGLARYDARGEAHYHLRDTASGEIYDLPIAFDPDLLQKIDPDLPAKLRRAGFVATGYRLEVQGHPLP